MAKYKLRFKSSVKKDLRGIPKNHIASILELFDAIAIDPHQQGTKKLTGHDRYRIRTGNYRVIYEIQDDVLVVIVVNVGHRSSVYKR